MRLLSFLTRLFKRPRPAHAKRRLTREEINALPLFDALPLERVVAVDTPEAAARAREELLREPVVGFDTESRPTFTVGEVSRGPHVVQFAAPGRTYVFTLHDVECRRVVQELIASAAIKKVGFGLDQDRRLIPRKLNVQPRALEDLERHFAKRGYGPGVGVKAGVAIVFHRRFIKSKSVSTSNWSRHPLSPKQLLYAANDAYAALRVYEALMKV